jgi:hypothetical protein
MENAPETETPTAAAATAGPHRLGSGFGGPEGIPPIPPPPPPPPRTTTTSLGAPPSYEAELKLLFYGDPNWAVEPVSGSEEIGCPTVWLLATACCCTLLNDGGHIHPPLSVQGQGKGLDMAYARSSGGAGGWRGTASLGLSSHARI